jgi:propanol-preferring alcohol dehydrogenase
MFQLHAAGKTKVIYETRTLDQVNEAFEEVETARVQARLVFDFRDGTRPVGEPCVDEMTGKRPAAPLSVPDPEQPTNTATGETGPIPG